MKGWQFWASNFTSVGQNPDSFSAVRCAGMVSSQHSPFRIIPHLGQVSNHSSKPARSEHWRVLHEHESRFHLANDSGHFRPEPASLSGDTGPISGDADVLAWKSTSDNVDQPSPRLPVKGPHIVPDWERLKDSVALSCEQDAPGIGSKLNSADGAPPKELSAQDASS
jgi:hypothetical protein